MARLTEEQFAIAEQANDDWTAELAASDFECLYPTNELQPMYHCALNNMTSEERTVLYDKYYDF